MRNTVCILVSIVLASIIVGVDGSTVLLNLKKDVEHEENVISPGCWRTGFLGCASAISGNGIWQHGCRPEKSNWLHNVPGTWIQQQTGFQGNGRFGWRTFSTL